MGQVYSGNAKIYLFFLSLFVIFTHSEARDARQLTLMVADFDGTIGHNVGHFRLRRVNQVDAVSPFFSGVTSLPEEISVPVHDYEGNVGPQIAKRIGRIDEKGRFIASTSLDPVTLSNGQVILPGYYYFDLQSSLKEFRPPEQGGESFLVAAIDEKLKSKTPFLLDAFPLFTLSMQDEYNDRVKSAMLSMRGNDPSEWETAVSHIQKKLKLPQTKLPREAYVGLSHPDFYEFAFSKVKYLERAFMELSDRLMTDTSTPHYLVMFENDREYIRQIDDLFKSLANRGVFNSPVVPVLVNMVETEVLNSPDGHNWDWSPMREITKMSRVTIYRPGKVERSNDISKVLELALDMKAAEAKALFKSMNNHPFSCANGLLAQAE